MTPAGYVLKRLAALLLVLCTSMAMAAATPATPLLRATTWFPADCHAWVFKVGGFQLLVERK